MHTAKPVHYFEVDYTLGDNSSVNIAFKKILTLKGNMCMRSLWYTNVKIFWVYVLFTDVFNKLSLKMNIKLLDTDLIEWYLLTTTYTLLCLRKCLND
jgi:hypothetical protein